MNAWLEKQQAMRKQPLLMIFCEMKEGLVIFMQPNINNNSLNDVYKSLFDFNHDACYALDMDGNFTLFNEEAVKITGYSAEESLKMNFVSILHEDYLEVTIQHFKRVIQGHRERFETTIVK